MKDSNPMCTFVLALNIIFIDVLMPIDILESLSYLFSQQSFVGYRASGLEGLQSVYLFFFTKANKIVALIRWKGCVLSSFIHSDFCKEYLEPSANIIPFIFANDVEFRFF